MFNYNELNYYFFGLHLGFSNLLKNGVRLGVQKTIGKVLQPINSYTRFPEYHFVGEGIRVFLQRSTPKHRIRILDVGSPKCFGLYLAVHFDVEIHLTDIFEPAVTESEMLWHSMEEQARGKVFFSVQDARSLDYADETFDVVYSMSVIEHVGGEAGDGKSVGEMLRVLKPGSPLLVTVPVGQTYVEQDRLGLEGAARTTGNMKRYFFQRIYTPSAIEERILKSAAPIASLRRAVTVRRNVGMILRLYGHLGMNARSLLGCFNPILSSVLNNSREGILVVPGTYSNLHSGRDVYGDLMLAWEKLHHACRFNRPVEE